MNALARMLRISLDAYFRLLKLALTALMLLMVVPVVLQILSRYAGIIPRYIWTEEVARFCFVWIVMIGSMIAVREESHFKVDLLPQPDTERQAGVSSLVVHVAMMLVAVVFALYGFEFARFGYRQTSEMSGINMVSIYASFPLAGVTWTIFLLERMLADIRKITGGGQATEL
ncbi:MAG: TRAP transporter small permease [Planctomycetota bacterium]|nr:TRAP transporter small permease [Planctomycetota bacterium]